MRVGGERAEIVGRTAMANVMSRIRTIQHPTPSTAVLAPDQPPPRDTLAEAPIVPMGVPGHSSTDIVISIIWDSSLRIRGVNSEFGALVPVPGIGTLCPNPFTVKATYLSAS